MKRTLENYRCVVGEITDGDENLLELIDKLWENNNSNIESVLKGYISSFHGHLAGEDFEEKINGRQTYSSKLIKSD